MSYHYLCLLRTEIKIQIGNRASPKSGRGEVHFLPVNLKGEAGSVELTVKPAPEVWLGHDLSADADPAGHEALYCSHVPSCFEETSFLHVTGERYAAGHRSNEP